jgi:protein required for attachment to host cells
VAMNKFHIPHEALVFVGDGRKALFLRNVGDEKFPNLKVERVFSHANPPAHDQGSDRPGRASMRAVHGPRSAMETTDWHEIEEHRFAHEVAGALEHMARTGRARAVLVVAPPRTLADLRKTFHADVRKLIIGEVDRDLTKLPVYEIEQHLAA